MNKLTTKIFLVIAIALQLVFINIKKSYATSFSIIGLDKSLTNSYLAEDESENTEIAIIVDNFLNNYIRPDMTDFEKEMQIIKYLVETVTYDESAISDDAFYNISSKVSDTYKAYGALVKHSAVCSGYAKAFDLLAKKAHLSSTIVTGTATNSMGITESHAWNQIYLDGDWYNVDVTWEDPITNINLGFNKLLNKYINRTDAEFSINHVRENGNICTGTKYGEKVVAYYLSTGTVNLNGNLDNVRKIYESQIGAYVVDGRVEEAKKVFENLALLGAKYEDNSNYIASFDDVLVNSYILNKLALGETVITIVTPAGSKDIFSIDKDGWLENNMSVNANISMYKFYHSNGENDVRTITFIFS